MEDLKPSLRTRQKRRDKRMGEELIECYRSGGRWSGTRGKGYKKRIHRNLEFAPAKESMKAIHNGGIKYPTDDLEPLIRFLNTHTGKYWNKVYSELSQKMDKNTMTGLHVFQHIWDFVEKDVWVENKRFYSLAIRFQRSDTEKHELVSYEKWPKFYIHPKTGVLQKARLWKRSK